MSSQAGLQWGLLAPVVAVVFGGMAILVLDVVFARSPEKASSGGRRGLLLTLVGSLALLVPIVAGLLALAGGRQPASFDPLQGHFQVDTLAAASVVLVGLSALLATWLSSTYLMALRMHAAEYFALVLFSVAGAFVAFSAEHLLVLFAGLELMALPAHLLAGFDRGRLRSNEAALKAFLSGALASGLLLYGMALLYGATGRLDYAGIRVAIDPSDPLTAAGLVLTLAGIGLRAGLAPFHQWVPDADEGAPTSVTAFVSACVRSAAVLVMLRFVLHALPEGEPVLRPIFSVLAVLGIAVGATMAAVQRNVKRVLAWAGVAHGGIVALAFVAGGADAFGAMIFYLLAQAIATVGALGVVIALASGGRELERLEDFAGIGQARPALALFMTLFLMGLAGLPGTAGFWARLDLLRTVVEAGDVGLVIVALLGTVVCLYAYMRVPVMMYMRDAPEQESSEASTSEIAVLLSCAIITVYLGVFPDPVLPGFSAPLGEVLRAATLSPF